MSELEKNQEKHSKEEEDRIKINNSFNSFSF